MNSIKILITEICVMLLLRIFWFVSDPRPIKKVLAWYLTKKVLLQSAKDIILLNILFVTTYYFPLAKTWFDFPIVTLGVSMFICGALITVWAKITLWKNWEPAGQQNNKHESELVTKGPYRFSRNPMYIGFLLTIIGLLLSLRSYLIILSIISIYRYYKAALKEEIYLQKQFGKEYSKYKSRVPMFI